MVTGQNPETALPAEEWPEEFQNLEPAPVFSGTGQGAVRELAFC